MVLAAFDSDAAPALADPLAMAGASDDSPLMRQIGIDVLPHVRQRGLAAHLVYELSRMVLCRWVSSILWNQSFTCALTACGFGGRVHPYMVGVCLNEHARYAAR